MTYANVENLLWDCPISLFLAIAIFCISVIGFKSRRLFYALFDHPVSVFGQKQYYRLFTGDLVHNDFAHLLLNEAMLSAYCTGLESYLNQVCADGSLVFLAIYLSSGFAGNFVFAWRNRRKADPASAGASGSIIGCMFSYILLKPGRIAFYLPLLGAVNNLYFGLIFIVGIIVLRVRTGNEMINHEVHFWGAIGGLVCTLLLVPLHAEVAGRNPATLHHRLRQPGPVAAATAPMIAPAPPNKPPTTAEETIW